MATQPRLKPCPEGHRFKKSSDCPTCPVCEAAKNPASAFLAELPAPARRALENAGVTTLSRLAKLNERELLALHGMGPASLPKVEQLLSARGLRLAKS